MAIRSYGLAILAVLIPVGAAGCRVEPSSPSSANEPPTVTITAPTEASVVYIETLVRVAAQVGDPDEGDLAGLTLAWTGDGTTGAPAHPTSLGLAEFTFDAKDIGQQSIQVLVTDPDGSTAADSVIYTVQEADIDGDGYRPPDDCDPNDPNVSPGAPEVCNGVDDDCSGAPDNELTFVDWYLDADRDGYGDPADVTLSCGDESATRVQNTSDCDDTTPALNRDDLDGDGVDTCDGDCDDTDSTLSPLSLEYCDDNIDNDCDAQIDPGGCVGLDWGGDVGGSLLDCGPGFSVPLDHNEPVYCGWGCYAAHYGLDFDGVLNDSVFAPVGGTITSVQNALAARPTDPADAASGCAYKGGVLGWCCNAGDSYGNYVIIKDRLGREWTVAHMVAGSISVAEGQVVAQGQYVGLMGNSGYTCTYPPADGSHVHVGVRSGGSWVDPAACLDGTFGGGVVPLDCWDYDEDTYGLGADCDSQDCDDDEPNYQAWDRDYLECMGVDPGGQACADRDGDGHDAGADCPMPDQDCNDFAPAVLDGCPPTNCSVVGQDAYGYVNQAIVDDHAYWAATIGCPVAHGPYGVYVHDVRGVDLQDFYQSDLAARFPVSDGYTGIAYDPAGAAAHLIRTGFWGTYKCILVDNERNGGAVLLGPPTDEEHDCGPADWVDFDGDYLLERCDPLIGASIQYFERGYMVYDGAAIYVHLNDHTSRNYDPATECVDVPVVENPPGPGGAPPTPSGLTGSYDAANTWNYLAWNAAPGAAEYVVYWQVGPGVTFGSQPMAPTVAREYAHSGVVPGSEYCYRVMATNPLGESGLSNEVCMTVAGGCPNGDGLYCGDPGELQDPDTLYDCGGGTYTPSEVCTYGCVVAAPGVDDYCDPGPGCTPNDHQDCSVGDSYWYDSCGVRGSLVDDCIGGETCQDAGATASCVCTANDHQDCYNGDVYWYNSCGVRGSLVDDCTVGETCQDAGATATCVSACACSAGDTQACGTGGVQTCDVCYWNTCEEPDLLLYRFVSTTGDQAHKFQTTTTPTAGFAIENGGNPVMSVFSYNPAGLTKLMQCSRISSRDYILTLLGGAEYNAINGADFTCYDNGWWVPNVSGSTYPGAVSLTTCLRGARTGGDVDHLFTLNAAELAVGFTNENSGFKIWGP